MGSRTASGGQSPSNDGLVSRLEEIDPSDDAETWSRVDFDALDENTLEAFRRLCDLAGIFKTQRDNVLEDIRAP